VVACGGGIVDTPDTRDILIEYYILGGIVLNVHRDATRVLKYLQIGKTRPAYEEDMMGVYMRHQRWYQECGNHLMFAKRASTIPARLAAEFDAFKDLAAELLVKALPGSLCQHLISS
jgi:shikimate kinase